MSDHQTIIAARNAWLAAENAYHAEVDKYLPVARLQTEADDSETIEAITTQAWAELTRLREAADEAFDAYRKRWN
jgi:hypothetical protein